jgi:hypothetical protein
MIGMQRKLKKIPGNSEIPVLTVSNNEHDLPKRRRGPSSIASKSLMQWRVPGNTVAAND